MIFGVLLCCRALCLQYRVLCSFLVVGGAAEKERAAETVVGGGCIVNEGV